MPEEPTKKARQQIVELLEHELRGPVGGETEELSEAPTSRYLLGMLAPVGTGIDPEEDDDVETLEEDEETGEAERGAPLGQSLNPSSIGMSFLVGEEVQEIRVKARWGRYSRIGKEEGGSTTGKWKRAPVSFEATIDVSTSGGRHRIECPDEPGVCIEWIVHEQKGFRAVSVFLVNRKEVPDTRGRKDDYWLFQPVLEVTGTEEGSHPFLARHLDVGRMGDADAASNALLFRNTLEFAVGHGVAVEWIHVDSGRAGLLRTALIPSAEVPRVVSLEAGGDANLFMEDLAKAESGTAISEMLMPLVEGYEEWIEQNEARIAGLPGHYQAAGREHLRSCREAVERMKAGLELIRENATVLEAFRFANEAMYLQRIHSTPAMVSRKTGGDVPSHTPRPEWRPFQMGFILLNIRGIVDPSHEDRRITDLLWFPTGGGKTEAYLGLAAFVFALRRLRGDVEGMRSDAGTAVLMRYTLRLLTVQQFQRASTLVCACEIIRRRDPERWGKEPFRIGLWVGRGTTPNSFRDSEIALSDLARGNTATTGNPVQLVSCPWCGSTITHRNFRADRSVERTLVGCGNPECDFTFRNSSGEGLPVVVVDEEIYRLVPSLVIATVDKFARMPWKGETQALFGNVDRYCPRHGFISPAESHPGQHNAVRGLEAVKVEPSSGLLPPELIIQDELHLISGPLGTLVGLYETAVDWLCSWRSGDLVVRPKVVASTATIRRATEQVKNLFNRQLRVFPPPGLDADDSYFSKAQPLENASGRLYLGIFSPGKSMKTALVRVYAVLLAAARTVFKENPEASDPYMTLVGYFNSLRELGGALRLVEDDVRSRLKLLNTYGFERRLIYETRELTSRIDSSEIPFLLGRLELPFQPERSSPYPIDVLLATNMISVGVDVDRLGLMVVAGQPKTTSEYIQATSRVGRRHPGLIVTVYKWSRPRDISHYERFGIYHATLYRHVEATSVTPFSSRARDRGLHGAMVAMCRLGIPGMEQEDGAGRLSRSSPEVAPIIETILSRVRDLDPGRSDLQEAVRRELDAILDEWVGAIERGNLRYSWENPYRKPPEGSAMLLQPAGSEGDGLWQTPTSLREVEPGAALYLLEE